MADSIGQAYVQILPTTKGFGSKLSSELGGGETAGALKGAGSKMGGFIKAGLVTAGIATAATAGLSKALVSGTKEVAEYGDNVDKMSQKIGISAEAYQEWDAVLQHSGANINSLKPSMKLLANQAQKNASEFQKLGISQQEVATLSQEELFAKTIEGLQNMGEGTERTALASKLLGRGATELGALLNTSAEETQKMKDRVHELGGVMSNEAVKDSAKFQDQLQDMNTSFEGLKRNLFTNFLPGLTTIMGGLTNIFSGNTEQGLQQINQGVEGLVNKITSILPKVLNIGGKILISLAQSLVTNLPTLLPTLLQVIMGISSEIIKLAPKLLQAGITLIIQLGQALIKGLPKLIPQVAKVITQLALMLTKPKNLEMMITTAIELMIALSEGLVKALPQIVKVLPQIIMNVVSTLIKLAPKLHQASAKMIITLAQGLTKSVDVLLNSAGKIIKQLISKFANSDWAKAGKDTIQGIINGVTQKADDLINSVKDIGKRAWKAFKEFFHIGSPSKLMADTAKWIPIGAAIGVEKNAHYLTDAVDDMMSGSYALSSRGMSMDISARDTSAYSYAGIYNAIKQGASEATPVIVLNDRVLSRELKGMGVSFA